MCHYYTKKNLLQKGLETEKKIGLGGDWIHSWAVCIDRQLMTAVFPLHQCLQRAVKDKQKQISISNQFPDDVHLISLKSHFEACLECQVTVLRKLKFKKRECKMYNFREKKIVHQLGFKLPTSCLRVSYSNNCTICALWFAMECCSASSSSTRCRAQTECHVNWWW